MANLRNPHDYQLAQWDWAPLNSCFRHGIRVSDLDGPNRGIVERHGHCLYIETKPTGYEIDVRNGQYRLWRALGEGGHTLLLIFGRTNAPHSAMAWRPHQTGFDIPGTPIQANWESIKYFCEKWFDWADQNGAFLVYPGKIPQTRLLS